MNHLELARRFIAHKRETEKLLARVRSLVEKQYALELCITAAFCLATVEKDCREDINQLLACADHGGPMPLMMAGLVADEDRIFKCLQEVGKDVYACEHLYTYSLMSQALGSAGHVVLG